MLQIQEARERELRRLKQAIPARVGMQTLLFAAPVLAAVASFAVYGSVDPDGFQAPRIFAAISLFAIMRFPLILPCKVMPRPNAAAKCCSFNISAGVYCWLECTASKGLYVYCGKLEDQHAPEL